MKCGACQSVLTQRNALGEPIIRNRGIVFKAGQRPTMVCPKCKASVPFSAELLQQFSQAALLIHGRSVAKRE